MPTARQPRDLTAPGALRTHDDALRVVTATVRRAVAAGATDKDVLERVLAGLLGLDLLGPAERRLTELLAAQLGEW